jgi:hypothetical protein
MKGILFQHQHIQVIMAGKAGEEAYWGRLKKEELQKE